MKRNTQIAVLSLALGLVAAACSTPATSDTAATLPAETPADSAGSSTPNSSSPTDAPTTEDSQPGTSSSDAPKPPPEGPAAPDFTMALESGGSFTLSDAAKPVYMVFWAEW